MPTVRVFCALNGFPSVRIGDYGDPEKTGVRISEPPLVKQVTEPVTKPVTKQPRATSTVNALQLAQIDADLSTDDRERKRIELAYRLLSAVNRLVRWYRFAAQSTSTHEYSLGAIGSFDFSIETQGQWADWGRLNVELENIRSTDAPAAIHATVLHGFASGDEPPLATLFLLDARHALSQGRFREVVLNCWSVIDSTFNTNFERLGKTSLAGEWNESVKFLLGNDFGLRHKMTIGMRLIGRRSLYEEPDDLWSELANSYRTRNAIIHEGASASEIQAHAAIWVTRRIVKLMTEL